MVERELRVALHRQGATALRLKLARYGVIGVSLFMLFGAFVGANNWGRTLHFFLFLAGLALAVGPALQISVGLFAQEREQQTLDLLYLTGMGAIELFTGKLLGAALVSSNELLALVPLIAVPFLSGGVSFEVFLETLACLPTLFVLVIALGALASALTKDESSALLLTGLFAGILCLTLPLPYNLGSWLTGKAPFDKSWLAFSAVLGPWMVCRRSSVFLASDFWRWAVIMWAVSFLSLTAAGLALKRNWRRDIQRIKTGRVKGYWEALALGNTKRRQALRTRLLQVNAYQWLAQQDRRPVVQAWAFVIVLCVFWVLGWCAWPRLWPTPLNFYTTGVLLLAGLDWLGAHVAARRMASDRRDGSLELLLTTPLSPGQVLEGQKVALDEQFRPVKLGVFALLLLMMSAGFGARAWTTQGIVSYLAIWVLFFTWCWLPAARSAPMAMWLAANSGRSVYGSFNRNENWNRIWFFYWSWTVARGFSNVGGFVRSFPVGSTAEMVITLTVMAWLLILMHAASESSASIAEALVSQLRSIAQEPLPERNDPRFKLWKDVRQRFPSADGLYVPPESSDSRPIKSSGAWFWRPVGRVTGLVWGTVSRAARRALKQNKIYPNGGSSKI